MSERVSDRIIASLKHRGPDGNGQQHSKSPDASISLYHTRLAIIDPLPRSNQPLSDRQENTIVFNGEIYNFQELAQHLSKGTDIPATRSDTEVLLMLYRKYGPEMVHHLRGMYAFVIWDSRKRRAFAARDAFGIKPLYLAQHGNNTVLASEISAILATGLIPKELSEAGVTEFFRWGSCRGNTLPLKHIRRLEPGCSLVWEKGILSSGPERFPWSSSTGTREDSDSSTRAALIDSVKSHLVSDVPVAAFLSSGIDSVTTLAAAELSGTAPPPSFTLSFPGTEIDESLQASKLAAQFNSPHTAIEMNAGQLTETFDHYINSQDLPGIDGFNTFCISQAVAAHGFKVVLSGLGGDELLGGYPSFQRVPRLIQIRKQARWLSSLLSEHHLTEFASSHRRISRVLEFINSRGRIDDAYETTRCLFSLHEIKQLQKLFGFNMQPLPRDTPASISNLSIPEQISVLEVQHYLNHQLLRDTDNFSMSHGLEIRVPFLDIPLWQTITALNPKSRFEPSKYLVQRAFPELPSILFEQKKQGFGLPWEQWQRGPLREQFEPSRHLPLNYAPTWYQSLSMVSFLAWCQRHEIEAPGIP